MKFIALLLLLCSCSSNGALKLKLIGERSYNSGVIFKNTLMGGLSGAYYDESKGLLYAVSDDKGKKGPFRIYSFKLELKKNSVQVKIHDVKLLTKANGKNYKPNRLDFEGIVIGANPNHLILSSEGHAKKKIPAKISVFSKSTGRHIKDYPLPEKYNSIRKRGKQVSGYFHNSGPEGLGITKDKKSLFVAFEQSLAQDDTPSTNKKSSLLRFIHYPKSKKNYKAQEEYIYELSKVPDQSPKSKSGIGLSEILPIDNKRMLVLERTYLRKERRNVIKLFEARITNDTTDVSGFFSIRGKKRIKKMSKRLLFDLSKISGSKFKIDNMEALAFGPKLKNGNKTLIVISDNNFNKKQRTLFLIFEILNI